MKTESPVMQVCGWWMRPCVAVLGTLLLLTACQAESISLEQLREARKQAAERQRRVIFNNDGNEPIYLCQDDSPEELLRHRTTPLAGTQVDSIFYCTWSSGFGMFTHDTKVGHVFKTTEDLFSKNRITSMLAAGTDPLQVMVDFGKKNDIEIFWSFRMNDTHDAGLSGYGPVMLRANPLKREHPEWLIGTPQERPKYGGWSAVDFTQPEVRELAVKIVEEVCQNYEVDGIELDFFRHPVFFKRAAQTGTPCNEQEIALMNDMLTRMRAVTEQAGKKRGKPILIAVRVPDSVEYCRAVGLDLETWLSQELIDLLMVSGYFQLNQWETSVELGRKYHVPVYPSLDESRVRDVAGKKLRSSVAAYRGRALNALQAGMSGVYLFNAFNPLNPIWNELGSREGLQTLDQDYFASIRGTGAAAGGAFPHRDFQKVETLNPYQPIKIEAGKSAEVDFPFGCDFATVKTKKTPRITLRLQFKQPPAVEKFRVQLNGKPLKSPRTSGDWLEYALTPDQLRCGHNQVQIELSESAQPMQWADLHCTVRWE